MDIAIEQTPVDQKVPPPGLISFEAFLEWMDEDTHTEWVDGEIIMTSPASAEHQDIKVFLVQLVVRHRGFDKYAPVDYSGSPSCGGLRWISCTWWSCWTTNGAGCGI